MLCRIDAFTQRAGVITIERLAERLPQRVVLRVLDQHGGPGDRLQRRPMQADGQTERENHRGASNCRHMAPRLGSRDKGQLLYRLPRHIGRGGTPEYIRSPFK